MHWIVTLELFHRPSWRPGALSWISWNRKIRDYRNHSQLNSPTPRDFRMRYTQQCLCLNKFLTDNQLLYWSILSTIVLYHSSLICEAKWRCKQENWVNWWKGTRRKPWVLHRREMTPRKPMMLMWDYNQNFLDQSWVWHTFVGSCYYSLLWVNPSHHAGEWALFDDAAILHWEWKAGAAERKEHRCLETTAGRHWESQGKANLSRLLECIQW